MSFVKREKCVSCGLTAYNNESIRVGQECKECKKTLTASNFTSVDGHIFCKTDYERLTREGKLVITGLKKATETPTTPKTTTLEAPKVNETKPQEPQVVNVEVPKKVEPVKVETPKVVETKKEEPKVVEVKKEEPKVETPKVVEPVKKEEPKVETPKVEIKKEEPKVVEKPVVVEIKKEEPKPVEVKVEPKVAKKEEVVIEDEDVPPPLEQVVAKNTTQDDDLPPLDETVAQQQQQQDIMTEDLEAEETQTKAEKKMKKSMEKTGMRPFKGVKEVQMSLRQIAQVVIVQQPEVFKCGDSFVIFGVGKMREKMPQNAQLEQLKALLNQQKEEQKYQQNMAPKTAPKKFVEENVDETGVDKKDIELIMKQVDGCTRGAAVKALKDAGGDLVNAIMSLTGV